MRHSVACAFVACLTWACGSKNNTSTGAAGATTSVTSTGVGGSGGSATGTGGNASGTGGSAAGTGGNATGGGGAPTGPLFPLVVGKVWTFKVKKIGAGGFCGAGTFDSTIPSKAMLDGKEGFTLTAWCDAVNSPDILAVGTGDEIFLHFNKAWEVVLSGKLMDGATWTFQTLDYKWKKEGSVTVAAGTFADCWSAVRVDNATIYDTYCRGVGPVKHHNETAGNGFEAELSAVK